MSLCQHRWTPVKSRIRAKGALYIYMAFCAWAGKCVAEAARCEDLIQRLAALVVNIPADVEGLAELKDVVSRHYAPVPKPLLRHGQKTSV